VHFAELASHDVRLGGVFVEGVTRLTRSEAVAGENQKEGHEGTDTSGQVPHSSTSIRMVSHTHLLGL
jgi:hypothetical protein